MRTTLTALFCLLFSLLVLPSCGDLATGGRPPLDDLAVGIDGTGTFLEESVRMETIHAARLAQSQGGQTRPQQDAAMVRFFLSDKNIEAAGIAEPVGNVWARFIDGTLYIDFSVRDQDHPAVRSRSELRDYELPGSKVAITANSLQSWWTDTSDSVAQMLKKGSLYNVTAQHVPLTVADFEAMKDVGVLYWQTHSGMAQLRQKQRDAAGNILKDPVSGDDLHVQAFGYMTNDVPVLVPPERIDAMRNQNLLVLGQISKVKGSVRPEDAVPVYGITASFITQKLSTTFAPDSLVAIDSCTGASPEMVAAWEQAGVGGFVGWNGLSGDQSGRAFELLFDRLLGANQVSPVSTPFERPFAFEVVRDWMKAEGHDLDPSSSTGKRTALVFWNRPTFGILRPSITNILFYGTSKAEPYGKLLIQGDFGSDPGPRGAVEWGGQPMRVVRWAHDGILVQLPAGPTYPTGSILVSVDGRKSQPAHFTEWNLPLTFTKTDRGSLKAVVTVNCRIRADVRGVRWLPEGPLIFTPMSAISMLDSSGSITADGVELGTNGNVVTRWSGTRQLTPTVSIAPNSHPSNSFSCSGDFDHSGAHPLKLVFLISAEYTVTTTTGSFQSEFTPLLHFPRLVELPTDWSTRTIRAGSEIGMAFGPTEKVTVSWPTVTPTATTGVLDQDAR